MAQEKKIEIEVLLKTADAAGSLKDVKKSLKELQDAMIAVGEESAEFQKLSNAAGELADKVEDVNQSIKANKGTSFEKFGGELGILGDKLSGLDFKGANESIGRIGSTIKGISFKDISGGVKEFTGTLVNMGKAILANPIFLIAAIIIAVGAALFALKDKVKIISDAFAFFGKIMDGIVGVLTDITDALGFTSVAADKAAQAQVDGAKKAQGALEDRYDAEIRLAKAAGKDVSDIELQKQKDLAVTLQKQLDGYAQLSILSEDQKKEQEEVSKALAEANLRSQEIILQQEKKAADEKLKQQEKANAEALKAREKAEQEKLKLAQQTADAEKQLRDLETQNIQDEVVRQQQILQNKYTDDLANIKVQGELKIALEKELALKLANDLAALDAEQAKQKAEKEKQAAAEKLEIDNNEALAAAELKALKNEEDLQAQIDFLTAQKDIELQNAELTASEKLLIEEKYSEDVAALQEADAEREKQLRLDTASNNLEIAQQGVNAIAGLSDLVFSIKAANEEKGSKKAEESAKKQFKLNKAFQIASAAIGGAMAIINSLASTTLPYPASLVGPISIGIATAASIAKIAATQFQGSGGGGGGGGSSASAGGGGGTAAAPAPPVATPPVLQKVRTQTTDNKLPGTEPIKAFVVSSDISKQQDKDAIIERRASF